jgi:hypothetical protein
LPTCGSDPRTSEWRLADPCRPGASRRPQSPPAPSAIASPCQPAAHSLDLHQHRLPARPQTMPLTRQNAPLTGRSTSVVAGLDVLEPQRRQVVAVPDLAVLHRQRPGGPLGPDQPLAVDVLAQQPPQRLPDQLVAELGEQTMGLSPPSSRQRPQAVWVLPGPLVTGMAMTNQVRHHTSRKPRTSGRSGNPAARPADQRAHRPAPDPFLAGATFAHPQPAAQPAAKARPWSSVACPGQGWTTGSTAAASSPVWRMPNASELATL